MKSLSKIKTVLLIAGISMLTVGCSDKPTTFNTAVVDNSSLEVHVTATGSVESVNQVIVGTQVSGIVEKIYVDFNSQVQKGELLASLDKSTLIEKMNQAQASVSDAQSNMIFAQQNYDRIKQLYDEGAATQATYEDATNRLNQSQNALKNASANSKQAQVNLSFADIYSPISGVILNRAVEQGQTVAAAFATPELFTIADDLTKMQIEAKVDEADIGRVRQGQSVTFSVDAYPEDIFSGTVEQIRLQPQITSNVVTYAVIISAPNPDEKLFPGMTANVSIVTDSSTGLIIPAEALNFIPDEKTVAEMSIDKSQLNNGHDRQVWVMRNGTLFPQKITTGINDGLRFIVKEGLKAGDEIVLSAVNPLKRGRL
jgi:HlyD family secretion protein